TPWDRRIALQCRKSARRRLIHDVILHRASRSGACCEASGASTMCGSIDRPDAEVLHLITGAFRANLQCHLVSSSFVPPRQGACDMRAVAAPAPTETMKITKVKEQIGAIVTGVDLAAPIDAAMQKQLYDAVVENVVLVIRGQKHLTPAQLQAAGE